MKTPSRFVRLFKPQFAPLVESGEKCQTVRPIPKRMPTGGDRISLREWTGSPYRSKQRVLREAFITRVVPIEIDRWPTIKIDGEQLTDVEADAFEIADGFDQKCSLWWWFSATHGLPFEGIVIYWND